MTAVGSTNQPRKRRVFFYELYTRVVSLFHILCCLLFAALDFCYTVQRKYYTTLGLGSKTLSVVTPFRFHLTSRASLPSRSKGRRAPTLCWQSWLKTMSLCRHMFLLLSLDKKSLPRRYAVKHPKSTVLPKFALD